MKGGDGAAKGQARQALIEPVEEIGAAGYERFEQAGGGAHCGGSVSPAGAQIAMRPVAEVEAHLGVGGGQAVEDFARVESDAGERVADAVGRVERDGSGDRSSQA